MRPSFVRRWIPLAAALSMAACSSDSAAPVASCAVAYTPSVLAHVTDSVTGVSLAETALGVIQDHTIVDTLRYFGPPDEMAAGGKPGTYAVTITHAGYADWTRTNVIVTPTGYCNTVNTVTLQARLVPSP
jgi:hypothetical protein